MKQDQIWLLEDGGSGPLVAAAIHDGHELRDELHALMALSELDRLREQDPFTGEWTRLAPIRIVGSHSRFEVDLNRSAEKAIYRTPEDAWGLEVWKGELPVDVVARSRERYDAFYAAMHELFSAIERRSGKFVVYDLHTYNHRRSGPAGPEADAEKNPQVNVGTGTMDRSRWASVVDRFVADLRAYPFPGGPLDVRENVKFQGGNFSRWIHENFPESGCSLAIEFKKFFMDEWTGKPDRELVEAVGLALRATTRGVREEIEAL